MPKNKDGDEITPAEVYRLYYERMAIYTCMSPLCRKIVQQYAADHEDEVLENVKDILDGKYELNALLGLKATRRQAAVRMMAAYITEVESGGGELLAAVMRAYNKDAAKLKLPQIRRDRLRELYDDIIESDDMQSALDAFTDGWLNAATQAFYLVEAVAWSAGKEDKVLEKLLSAAYFAIQTPADCIKGRNPCHPDFFEYLMRRAQKEFFISNTMSALLARDSKYIKTHKLNWSKINYGTPEYREYVRIASIAQGVSGGGALQEQLLEQVTFTKEKKREIVGTAYAVCCFDSDEKFDLDGMAKAAMEGREETSPEKQRQIFRKAVSTFDETLFYMAYLNAIVELYRRSALAELSAEFFTPQGQVTTKRLKLEQKRLELVEKKNRELAQQIKGLAAENADAVRQAAEARNKWAGIQGKVEALQAENEDLRRQLAKEKSRANELERQIAELAADDTENEALEAEPVPETNYQEKLTGIFEKHKVVFVGGNFNIMSKFGKRNPAAIIIPKNRIATADQQIVNADVILMKTDSMSHKEYYKFKQIAVRKGIPLGYIENRANVQLMEQDVYETLELMGFD